MAGVDLLHVPYRVVPGADRRGYGPSVGDDREHAAGRAIRQSRKLKALR